MPIPQWADFFKLFSWASEKDPLAKKKDIQNLNTAGTSQPDALSFSGDTSGVSYRQTYDMIDVTTLNNRPMRYKEYERLRNMPEIEQVMTVLADEACVAGNTKIATPFGNETIESLTKKYNPEERFLVYCWDFEKNDYTLGWAFNPRKVKTAATIQIILDDGSKFVVTPDHRILTKDNRWIEAGKLVLEQELKPFYRVPANYRNTKNKLKQYPRIFSTERGWIHERQFVDEWKSGKPDPHLAQVNRVLRMIASGLPVRKIAELMERDWHTLENWFKKEGFSLQEIKSLTYHHGDCRRIVSISPGAEIDVYDLSVEKHQCFATDSVIMHNCQKDEDGNVFKVTCENEGVKKEIEWLLRHRKMLNLNRESWTWFKNLCIFGDWFVELVVHPDDPKEGIAKVVSLPPESMYRIESTKTKLIEFQQVVGGREGPDYTAVAKAPIVTKASEVDLAQSQAIRFSPFQIVHFRIGDDRKTFYPYGQSLIEPARGPAHSLRLMEDAMVTYRLCLIGNTRIRTNNGYKFIKDMQVGDIVYSLVDNLTMPTKVTSFINNGIKEVFTVKSKHVEITGTATHPILVNRNGEIQYVEIQNLRVKEDKLLPRPNNWGKNVEIPRIINEKWAKLSDELRAEFRNKFYKNKAELMRSCTSEFKRTSQFLYAKGKALPYDKAVTICNKFGLDCKKLIIVNKNERNESRINLPLNVNEEFARLFGFLLGDGFMYKENNFGFAAGTDKKVNEYYCNLLQKFFGEVKFSKDRRSAKGCGKYVVCNAVACKILTSLGYAKHDVVRIPSWAYTANQEIRRALVEGISDADGCERFTKKGTWFSTIELGNKLLVHDIKELWSSIGMCSGHIRSRRREGGHEIEPGRKMPPSQSYSVTISDCLLPAEENVLQVTPAGEQEVFDISVDNPEHNFIANGIPVHNSRAPERRIFYVDVGQLPPFKAESFVDRLKDQFRKRKTTNNQATGANQVEEKWQPPAVDEDIWMPIRPGSQTRIETLPGAQNLGEIDDAIYFRNKLFTALNFPKNYFANEDTNATRITLSAQDVKFARMVERLQSYFEEGLLQISERHLELRGFPEEIYEDLKIKMTPPSDWRELSRAEVVTGRYGNATTLKSGQLMSDWDIMTKILKFNIDETDEMLSRLKIQKLEDLKLQIMAQNPQLLGIGIPGQDAQQGQELGAEAGGPSANPAPMDEPQQGSPEPPAPPPDGGNTPDEGSPIEEAEPADIKKYDLEIQNYELEQDEESQDYSVGD